MGLLWNAANGMTDIGIPATPWGEYLSTWSPHASAMMGRLCLALYRSATAGGAFATTPRPGFRTSETFSPAACTADGTEAVGIEDHVFPGDLVGWKRQRLRGPIFFPPTASRPALGIAGPVTISPDGSAITALGPDAHNRRPLSHGTLARSPCLFP